MSDFDPATFMNETITDSLDTEIIPCPVGEYLGVATKVDINKWQKKDGSASGLRLDITWEIQDENAKTLTGRDPLRVRQQQMLDLKDDGSLDVSKGRNVGLGRIREALGLNKSGKPFAFSMIQGNMAKVLVKHRAGDNGQLYDEVSAITAP